MATQVDIPMLLSKLVASSLSHAGVPENEILQRQVYLLRFATSILGGSAISRSSLEGGGDETALVSGLKRELEATGSDKANKVMELCNRLSPSSGKPGLAPRTRLALLVLLRQLRREPGGSGHGGRGAPPVSLTQTLQLGGMPASYAPPPTPLGTSSQQHQLARLVSSLPGPQQRPNSAASCVSGLVRPYSVITPSELGDDPSLSLEISRMSLAGGEGGTAQPGAGVSATAGMTATIESSLVRDVLYAAQGVQGRTVRWMPGPTGSNPDLAAGFRPDPATAASDLGTGRAMLLTRLTELGWLFRRVREHISDCSCADQASVRQALGAAMAAEVGDFYRLLALLEAQAAVPLPTPGDTTGGASGQYLTLKRLLCWLTEPLRRMQLLVTLGDAGAGLEGGALAGAVYEFTRHGDPFLAAYAAKLLQQVCVPLYDIIRRWVLEGELDDQYNEFFVVQHAAAAASGAALADVMGTGGAAPPAPPSTDLWRQSYGLDESRLPPFIGPHLAQRILRAGKAIHYLKLACGDGGWVQQRAEAWSRAPPAAAAAASGSGEVAGLEGLVSDAVRSVDERLLTVMWRHHRLRAHFAAIRRFLLLGQGDWVTAFIDLAQRELDKPANEVSEVALNGCLRQALTATNVLGGGGGGGGGGSRVLVLAGPGSGGDGGSGLLVGEDEGDDEGAVMGLLAEKLRVRKDRAAGAGETGWDVFSLHYNPAAGLPAAGAGATAPVAAAGGGGPLSALFTPTALLSYSQLARLLWRLKRAEHALSSTWGAAACGLQRAVDKLGADGYLVQPVLAMLLRLRSDMSHFATNLQYYIQFEVMEASWQDFYSRAASCADLDSLIAAHEAHLATLLRKALLATDGSRGHEGAAAGTANGGAAGPTSGASAMALRRALQDALTNMVTLRALAGRLEEIVRSGELKLQQRKVQGRARGSVAAVAVPPGGPAGVPGGGAPIPPEDLKTLRSTLADLRAQHQRAVAEFTENLPEEAQDDVRFLLARLDFSGKGTQFPSVSGVLLLGAA